VTLIRHCTPTNLQDVHDCGHGKLIKRRAVVQVQPQRSDEANERTVDQPFMIAAFIGNVMVFTVVIMLRSFVKVGKRVVVIMFRESCKTPRGAC
jgi:hypothetical protein